MKTDTKICQHSAQVIQGKAATVDDLLIWTIYERPADFPNSYIARPFSTLIGASQGGVPYGMRCYLEAATLNELRLLLPMGLYRLERNAADDKKIVETWL
jgi:hypothetical protein